MGNSRISNAQGDFLVLGVMICGEIWWQRKCHLACSQHQRQSCSNLWFDELPKGPVTSTADTGTSFFRLLMFDLGKSKKRSDTSGGIGIAALPIRERLAGEHEKLRA